MNIAILCHASAGGSGVVATELAVALAKRGHQVHIVAPKRPFRLSRELDARSESFFQGMIRRIGRLLGVTPVDAAIGRERVQFHQIGTVDYPLFDDALSTLTAANTLARLVEEHHIEIVHAHYAIPHATSALLAREVSGGSFKVVTTLHGTDVTLLGLEPALRHTTRHAIEASDAVTAVSHDLARHTREAFGIHRPIHVIHNWVDPERFKPIHDPLLRARFAQPDEALLIHVSNFRRVKRPQDVIRVFARVAAKLPARLLMVGDGPERPECFALAQELEVMGRVQFLEFIPEVERVLGLADLMLMPSEQESFGLAVLEGMACGVPVVASRVGGLPEVVEEGKTGYLRVVGDIEGMAEAALEALSQPVHHQRLGEQARVRAVERFHPDVIVPQYLEVYREVLSKHQEQTVETESGAMSTTASEGVKLSA